MRPLGVSLIGVLYILLGVVFLVLGVLGVLSLIGISGNMASSTMLPFFLVEKYVVDSRPTVPLGVTLLLVHVIVQSVASNISGGAALSFLLLPGTVTLFVGGGLLKLFNWARKLAIAFSVAALATGLLLILMPFIGTIIGLLLALFSILVLLYLSKSEIEGLFT